MSASPSPTKTLRPFKPLPPRSNRQRSISPPPDIDSGINSTPLPASSGMFLLVRNVLPTDKPGYGKPVDLVKKAIAEICETEEADLATISLDIVPGGRPQDPNCASAYIDLTHAIKLLDHLPRPDLLSDWKAALAKSRPSWDIVWAPQKKGKDRRMTVRFRVAESKESVPANATDKIRAHLESKGHKTVGGYISFNGLVDISFANTNSVDTILASTYYHVPSLSKDGLHVSAPKFIAIENPFELCIGGINEYEGIHEVIEKWLYHVFAYDDALKSTRVHDTRISSDRDYFIFTMDSWDSTILVMKSADAFRTYFTRSPLLTDPKLVFDLNSSGFARKNVTSVIEAGAGLVNDAISEVKRELSAFRKEQTENNMLVQQQVASIHGAMEKQTNALTIMENQLSQFGLSLLSGRDEKAIECKISAIDNSLMSELQWMRHADDPAEKQSFKNNIAALQSERRELVKLLANASESTLKLLGPAPGTLFPPIAMIAAAVPAADLATATVALPATPIVPTIAVAQLQTPVVPLTPAVPLTPSEAVSQTPTIRLSTGRSGLALT